MISKSYNLPDGIDTDDVEDRLELQREQIVLCEACGDTFSNTLKLRAHWINGCKDMEELAELIK